MSRCEDPDALTTTDAYTTADLIDAGWRRTASGRFIHPGLPTVTGAERRRLFTEDEALTLHAAWYGSPCPDCGAFECPGATRPTHAIPEAAP